MITTAKQKKDNNINEIPTINFLTINGDLEEHDLVLNNEANAWISTKDADTYGKVESTTSSSTYYIKRYRGGRSGELLVNPYGMFSKKEDLSAFVSAKGQRFCEYFRVPEFIFNSYVSYLKTRNARFFDACEKYIKDTVL